MPTDITHLAAQCTRLSMHMARYRYRPRRPVHILWRYISRLL